MHLNNNLNYNNYILYTCSCIVNWNVADAKMNKKHFDHLANCQMEHQYPSTPANYTIMAMYCLIDRMGCIVPGCCAIPYQKTIHVSYDPNSYI